MEVLKIWEKNMEKKQQIRAELKKKRNTLTSEQHKSYSRIICEKIWNIIEKEKTEIVYCYYPLGNEADVLPLAEKALKEGRKVAFPRTNGETMEFYQVTCLTEFQEGAFHIMEPLGGYPLDVKNPLVVVPGLGFDKDKNRIGYGKGFYDRYFARFPSCRKIGAAYEAQIIDYIPTDKYDTKMDIIITEGEGIE